MLTQRQARVHPVAALGTRARLETAVEERDALAHPHEPVAAGRAVPVGRAAAVVEHLEVDRVGAVGDRDPGPRRARVLERVGERLLDDPVRRQVEARGKVGRLALDGQLDGQAGGAHGLGKVIEACEAGLRREQVAVVGLAHHPEHPVHLGERAAPRLLDVHQGL